MNTDEARDVFSKYLSDNGSTFTTEDYEIQSYNQDAVIFARQAAERPNSPYMVRNGKVASVNYAHTTIEEVYSDLA